MLQIKLLGAAEAQAWAREAPAALKRAIERALGTAARRLVARAKRIVYAGHPEHLEGDTGRLRGNITSQVHGDRYAEVGTNVKYAKIHEFGGTVRAADKALSIPVGDRKGSPTQYGDLRWAAGGGERGRLVDAAGNTQYVLVDEVTIPARPTFGPALEQGQEEVREAFVGEIRKAMGKAAE